MSKKPAKAGAKVPVTKPNTGGPASEPEKSGTTTMGGPIGTNQGDVTATTDAELKAIESKKQAALAADQPAARPAGTTRAKITQAAENVIQLSINNQRTELRVGEEYDLTKSQIEALRNANIIVEEV